MPNVTFVCEVCGREKRRWTGRDVQPRFCSRECRNKGLFGKSLKPLKWRITPEMHERIRDVYQNVTGNGEVRELGRALGLPRWKLTRYAISQGWLARHRKEPVWTETEVNILEQSAHFSLPVIQRRLKKAGFARTEIGIQVKRKRMRYPANLKGQSALATAGCFGVTEKNITAWIKKGWLKAGRRGTARTAAQGGDQWFIKERAIRKFVISYVEVIDFRKVDKFWLVDLLAGGDVGTGPSVMKDEG